MKKISFSLLAAILLIISLTGCGDTDVFSFVNKTVTIDKAGGLANALTFTNLASINTLKISGKMDSRDFKTIRDHMSELKELDISNVTIEAYKGYEGTGGTEVYEYPANTIPIYAFYNSKTGVSTTNLINVMFPSTLKAIGFSAFTGCAKLNSLSLPDGLKNIGDRSFARCNGLTDKLIIPAKVDTIGYSAFAFCTSLKSVLLSDSLLFIGESAFNGCTALAGKLNLPYKLQSINDNAFQDCTNLTEINISGALSSLGNAVFQNCVCSINVSTDNSNFSSSDGVLFDYSQTTLKYCPAGKTGTFEIPGTVTTIDYAAFSNCKHLTSIIIPSSVTQIIDYAFSNCSGLTGTFNIPNSVNYIGSYILDGCNGISAFNVATDNTSYISIDGVIFDISLVTLVQFPPAKSGTYEITSSVTTISTGAFKDCKLTSIHIPATVTAIYDHAFVNCTDLTSIYEDSTTPIQFITDNETISWSVFYNVSKTNCILFVPKGSKNAYQNASQWKDFINISEI